eukprot:m.403386 g.403386  ORF g.403386 m.403386 type:complete len:331 (-) comp28409_c0_seq4:804-1796(-)
MVKMERIRSASSCSANRPASVVSLSPGVKGAAPGIVLLRAKFPSVLVTTVSHCCAKIRPSASSGYITPKRVHPKKLASRANADLSVLSEAITRANVGNTVLLDSSAPWALYDRMGLPLNSAIGATSTAVSVALPNTTTSTSNALAVVVELKGRYDEADDVILSIVRAGSVLMAPTSGGSNRINDGTIRIELLPTCRSGSALIVWTAARKLASWSDPVLDSSGPSHPILISTVCCAHPTAANNSSPATLLVHRDVGLGLIRSRRDKSEGSRELHECRRFADGERLGDSVPMSAAPPEFSMRLGWQARRDTGEQGRSPKTGAARFRCVCHSV